MRYIAAAAALMALFGTHGALAADGQSPVVKTESEPIVLNVDSINAIIDSANFEVDTGDGLCSGTLLAPVKYRLIQTAYHCISNFITNVDKDVNEDGEVKKKTIEVFGDVKVSQTVYSDTAEVGGSKYVAEIVGYDKIHDLGLLRLKTEKIPNQIGVQVFDKRFGKVERGEKVWAMGNPLGLFGSYSEGTIASTHRFWKLDNGDNVAYYQTSAMVTFGNSGGALMDMQGHLIGIPDKVAPGTTVAIHVPYTFVQELLTKNCYEDVWNDKAEKSYDDCEAAKKAKAEDKTTTKDLLKQLIDKKN